MSFENRYGRLDRLLHRCAFRALLAQEALADLEDQLFSRQIDSVDFARPVFVSGLPRSGTTILLDMLVATGYFATHTYRDMPFVLCPLFWGRFSRFFATEDLPRERAHGDGLMVSLDSPESFEEVIWMRFWAEHYRSDRIQPWTNSTRNTDFEDFFGRHMRKIVVARRTDRASNLRYLSKNNVNIARVSGLPGPLSQGSLLIPFRHPVQHAASMLNQHRRFLKVHRADPFARLYVSSVGHQEFGQALRPVDFGGWLSAAASSEKIEYWVRYWVAAYSHVLDHRRPNVHLLSYDELTRQPGAALEKIARSTQIPPDVLAGASPAIRSPQPHDADMSEVDPTVLDEARGLFARLIEAT